MSLQGVEEREVQVVACRRAQQERQHVTGVGGRIVEAPGFHLGDATGFSWEPRDGRPEARGGRLAARSGCAAALTCGFPLPHTWPLPRDELGDEREESQIAIEVGATIQATVARIENYGAFLQLEDGRMGLVHISEIDRNYVKDVREHLREGDTRRGEGRRDQGRRQDRPLDQGAPGPGAAPSVATRLRPGVRDDAEEVHAAERRAPGGLPPGHRAQAQVAGARCRPNCAPPTWRRCGRNWVASRPPPSTWSPAADRGTRW